MVVQGVESTIDAMLDPILMKQFQMMNGKRLVNLGNNTVEVHDLFRLYLITSLPNPHYTP